MKFNFDYKWFIFIFVIFCCCSEGRCARILAVSMPYMKSHHILMHKLMRELVLRGHEVTYISAFKHANPIKNLREITVTYPIAELSQFNFGIHQYKDLSSIRELNYLLPLITPFTLFYLNCTSMQSFLKSKEQFDLVIHDSICDYALTGFAHHFDAKLIIFSTVAFNGWLKPYTNLVYPASYIPAYTTGYSGEMTFFQRAHNAIVSTVAHKLLHRIFQEESELLHKFWPDAPDLLKLIKDRSPLVLLNSHYSFSLPKPSVPHVIEIGGYHIEKPKELPEDLQKFLDSAENGAILFSLGSSVNFSKLPTESQNMLLDVFKKLPYKILWKVDTNIPEISTNVLINKWLPQNDILAHRNIKLFMTHGGLLSIAEAIYHAVPLIGFPIFADQKSNMAFTEQVGIGKVMYLNKLSSVVLLNTILEMIDNPAYQENIRKRSIMLRDQPIPPLDKAMYWIDYVLKHNSTHHLHTGAENLELYQILLLDVLAMAFIIFVSMTIVLFIIYKKITRTLKQKQSLENSKKGK